MIEEVKSLKLKIMEKLKQHQPSSEEIAEIEKSRTISDAELLKGGADFDIDENGKKRSLLLEEEQENKLRSDFLKEDEILRQERLKESLQKIGLIGGEFLKEPIKVKIRFRTDEEVEKISKLVTLSVGNPIYLFHVKSDQNEVIANIVRFSYRSVTIRPLDDQGNYSAITLGWIDSIEKAE